ncbi:MAG: hypothetical protein DSY84_04075, partial [Candidatus Neomarinimicrobiota bacterium]
PKCPLRPIWTRAPEACSCRCCLGARQPPVCGCGGYLKPATISFGQNLDPDDLARAAAAVQETDLVVALGSTLSVHPAAGFPLAAAQRGVPYVVVNRGVTDHDGHSAVTLRLDGDVVELFPPAVAEALAASSRSSCADGAASPPGRRV